MSKPYRQLTGIERNMGKAHRRDGIHVLSQSWAPNSLPWKETALQNTENWLFTVQIYFVFIDLTTEAKIKKPIPKTLTL